jgi:hypothetical protein
LTLRDATASSRGVFVFQRTPPLRMTLSRREALKALGALATLRLDPNALSE